MARSKRKKSNSKSGLIPPSKTNSKMAAPIVDNQNNMNVSKVLSQAHGTLHDSYIKTPVHTQENNNQTFTCSPTHIDLQQQTGLCPVLQSTPLPGPPPMMFQNGATLPPPPPPIQFMPPPVTTDIMQNVTPQMIYSNMYDTNQRLQRLEQVMTEKLSKLDLLDEVAKKLDRFESNMSVMRSEINEIRDIQNKHSQVISQEEKHHHNIEDRVRDLEFYNSNLEHENNQLKEKFLEIQTHSMKYNLIFDGIKNESGFDENTEAVLRTFLTDKMQIPDA